MNNHALIFPTAWDLPAQEVTITNKVFQQYRAHAQKQYAVLPDPTLKTPLWQYLPLPTIAWSSLIGSYQKTEQRTKDGYSVFDIQDFVAQYLEYGYLLEHAGKDKVETLINGYAQRHVVLYIPPSAVVKKPIDITAILGAHSSDLSIAKMHIIIGSGAQAKITERYDKKIAQANVSFRSLSIVLEDGALLEHSALNDLPKDSTCFLKTYITLKQNASYTYQFLHCGGAYTKQWLDVDLIGQHAQATISGAYLLAGKEQFDFIANQNHYAPKTTSALCARGILAGSAHAVYQGLITVDQKADGTDARQENKNILLSDMAKAHSVPTMEVKTDDVSCLHGSAIAKLDAELVWYVQSRGLSYEQAQKLLLQGFLHGVYGDSSHALFEQAKQVLQTKF